MAILVIWWKNLSLRYIVRIVGPQSVDQSTVRRETVEEKNDASVVDNVMKSSFLAFPNQNC